MKRTFCTVIRDEQAEEILAPMAELFARVRHWAFREIHIRGRKVKDVKRESLVKFGITARHFNGIRFDLDQDANAWKEGLKYRQQSLKDRIKDLSKQIAGLEKRLKSPKKKLSNRKKKQTKFTIHQKKRHLGIQKHKLTVVESDLAGKPKVCFGGRKLLRRDEVWEWRERRSSRINLVGAGDETAGNQSAQWDGKALAIRLPNALGGERKVLTGITFRYGQEELLRALESKAPLTWVLFRDEQGRWQARVTIENDVADITCDTSCGIIGVDLNVDHLAVVMVDRMGNPVGRESIPFPVSGTASDKASGMIGEAIKQLTDMALERGCAVAVENLDFSRKKANLKSFGKRHARRLSGFAYSKFFTMLEARCERFGIELKAVNPAYTSVIGKLKYAPGFAMSAHHAAALVIARRAMGFGERFVCMLHGTLVGPGRNRPRHVWSRWRDARRRRAREDVKASVRTAASGVGCKRSGVHHPVRASAAAGLPHGVSTHYDRSPARDAVALANKYPAVTVDT